MNLYQEKKDVQEERLENVASLDKIGSELVKDIAKKQQMLDLVHAEKARKQKHFALDVPIPGKLTYEDLEYQNDDKLILFEVDSNDNQKAFAYSYKFENIKKAFEEEVSKE